MKKHIFRRKDARWCRLDVELTMEDNQPLRLSISGAEGEIIGEESAEERAREYWRSFFEESPEELGAMLTKYTDEMVDNIKEYGDVNLAAAQVVLDVDGPLYGLDVDCQEGTDVFITESCGQIGESLREWFPEVRPWLKWHLNDMCASCEHQESLGWDGKRDIALTRADCTQVQLEVLDGALKRTVERERIKMLNKYLSSIQNTQGEANRRSKCSYVLRGMLENTSLKQEDYKQSIHLLCDFADVGAEWSMKLFESVLGNHRIVRQTCRGAYPPALVVKSIFMAIIESLHRKAEVAIKLKEFESEIFKACLNAPCPVCGYRYGTKWLRRELPNNTLEWFNSLK